jgi:hypothetical protein
MRNTIYTCDYCQTLISEEEIDRHNIVYIIDSDGEVSDYHISCFLNKKIEDELDEKIRPE